MTVPAPRPAGASTIAAFFDVDNTIIRGASAFHIARGMKRRGFLRTRDIIRFGWEQLKYVTFGERATRFDEIRDSALSLIRGLNVAEVTSIGEEIYDEVLALKVFSGTHDILKRHLARGHEVWLVTASPVEVGRLIARRLGATGALGTVAEHRGGYYTGALVGEMLHGASKADAARRLADDRGIDLENSFAYGDSANDVPILSAVGYPCAINPERRLRRYAKRQGWPIRDFRGKRGDGRRSLMATTGAGALWATLTILRAIRTTLLSPFRALRRLR